MAEVTEYFAYGSNLHPERLGARAPSARFLCIARLAGYRLAFHKRSRIDGSGKCNIVAAPGPHNVWGAVYELGRADLERLDGEEVVHGGYLRQRYVVYAGDARREVHAYEAPPDLTDEALSPFDWYHALVLDGARLHGLPQDYVAMLESIAVTRDRDRRRRRPFDELLRVAPSR